MRPISGLRAIENKNQGERGGEHVVFHNKFITLFLQQTLRGRGGEEEGEVRATVHTFCSFSSLKSTFFNSPRYPVFGPYFFQCWQTANQFLLLHWMGIRGFEGGPMQYAARPAEGPHTPLLSFPCEVKNLTTGQIPKKKKEGIVPVAANLKASSEWQPRAKESAGR
jgi:hypothetical protein